MPEPQEVIGEAVRAEDLKWLYARVARRSSNKGRSTGGKLRQLVQARNFEADPSRGRLASALYADRAGCKLRGARLPARTWFSKTFSLFHTLSIPRVLAPGGRATWPRTLSV